MVSQTLLDFIKFNDNKIIKYKTILLKLYCYRKILTNTKPNVYLTKYEKAPGIVLESITLKPKPTIFL